MESILTSIKKLLGIPEEDIHFDTDIIIHINSAFSRLHRLGVGTVDCFNIQDALPVWSEFTEEDNRINDVKTYVYLKVKLVFDPPLSSSVLEAMKATVNQLEWELASTSELINLEDSSNVEI